MILSNVAIQRCLDDGDLYIGPEPPRAVTIENPNCAYDTTSVNLRLASTISIPKQGKPFAFDLRQSGIGRFLAEVYQDHHIDEHGGYTLQRNFFVLGNTMEKLKLPIREGRPILAARVEGRSSLARCGLLVHFTAPTIHAGFEGTITLEMVNLGSNPITLYPGMEICQLIFERVEGVPTENPSQFHGQSNPAGERL